MLYVRIYFQVLRHKSSFICSKDYLYYIKKKWGCIMLIDERIVECEFQYTKCFSEFYENEDIIRFRDNQLSDMYYHNYTYLKKQ